MPSFKSPLGNTSSNNITQPRHLVVDDQEYSSTADPSMFEIPENARPFNPAEHFQDNVSGADAIMNQRQRMIDAANAKNAIHQEFERKAIEALIGIGRIAESVNISGINFEIQTLKSKEKRHILLFVDLLSEKQSRSSLIDIKNATLAYAINSIDGVPLNNLLKVSQNTFEARMDFVNNLDDNVTDYLFDMFNKIDAKAKSYISGDMKETAEAVKKSG